MLLFGLTYAHKPYMSYISYYENSVFTFILPIIHININIEYIFKTIIIKITFTQ